MADHPMPDQAAQIEMILKQRARRLALPRVPAGAIAAKGRAVLCFSIGREVFALPLSDLSEVTPLGRWTPVPGQSRHLLGVTNVRGEIRPVLDLHDMLTLSAPDPNQGAYALYLRRASRDVGVRVDGLGDIRFIDPGKLTMPHQTANGLPQRFIAGIDADTLILLDVQQILALDVLQDPRADHRRAI